jgi:YidC/Oxa1 family membrane protein insertase
MDKRVIVTIGVSLVLMWGWLWFSAKMWPPAPPPKPAAVASGPSSAPASAPGSQRSPFGAALSQPGSQPASARAPEDLVELPATPGVKTKFHATLTTWGGALKHFVLTDPQYKEEQHGRAVPIDLVRTGLGGGADLPFRTSFRGKAIQVPEDAVYRVTKKTDREVVFEYDGSTARVEKKYEYDPSSYVLNLTVSVTNKTGQRDDEVRTAVMLYGWQNPEDKGGGWFKPPRNVVSGACYVNGSLDREGHDELVKKPIQKTGDVRWVGVDEKYFLLAAVPTPAKDGERGCRAEGRSGDLLETELLYSPRSLAAGATESYPMVVFAGPKSVKLLDSVTAGGQEAHLGEAVNFGWFAFIARPLLWILKFFQAGVKNWGLAIILLTIFVKLITLYWTQKSMRSMKEMAKLKPKITALQEKYKDDKNRLNQEMMGLYKAHGVNPLSGCLPMLLQMPIWFALYSTLQVSVELYRAPFAFWITDLTAPDKYFVMPVLTGLLMFVQQKISPTPQDNQQAKMMMYMMPVMFTAFTLFVPSGLTLYILTNTVISMAHQAWMNRQDGSLLAAVPERPEQSKPAPKGSSKRKA